MSSFFGLFSVILAVGGILLGLLSITLLLSSRASFLKPIARIIDSKKGEIVFMVSVLACISSLIYSEVFGIKPCDLCWYQRIIMYPLPIIWIVGFLRKEVDQILPYVNVFSWMGLILSLYQYLSQQIPSFAEATRIAVSCGVSGSSCAESNISVFGFVTIPLLSLFSFLFLVAITSKNH